MLDKLAGYKSQIRSLEKKLKEMDHAKLSPSKVKEVTEAIKNLKELVKEKEDKKIERKKKKEEASKPVEVEKKADDDMAKTEPKECSYCGKDKETFSHEHCQPGSKKAAPEHTEEVVKEADVNKFAIDSRVEPVRGTPGSIGVVIREAGVNGDPLCYVKWTEGALKEAHGEYGAYYPSDLKLKAEVVTEAKDPTTYVPREQLYNLESDLKSNYEGMIQDLEEEYKTALDKGEAAWAHRINQKLLNIMKVYKERFEKTAEDENGSGGTNKLKVYDQTPAHDKDPQEKATGYGGDRPMGAMVAPNGEENSLPLESTDHSKCEDKSGTSHAGPMVPFHHGTNKPSMYCDKHVPSEKKASLNKQAINVTIAEKLFVVNPMGKTAENEYGYDVNLADGSKLFKITSADEMGQEHLAYVIEKELLNHKEAAKEDKCYGCGKSPTTHSFQGGSNDARTGKWCDSCYKKQTEKQEKKEKKSSLAKLTANLAFLKKGSFVSILAEDKVKGQIKFASLDNSLRGWAPMQKFAAMDVPSANLVDHEGHKDEVLAESGMELLVSCPAHSTNVIWREVTAPPATPESLNDMESSKQCKTCGKPSKRDYCSGCEKIKEVSESDRPEGYDTPEKKADLPDAETSWDADDTLCGPLSDEMFEHAKCPACGGHGELMGELGNKEHLKCKNCGIQYSHDLEASKKVPHTKECNEANDRHVGPTEVCICDEKKASLNIQAHIRHEDGKWIVYNHDYKKKLGTYDSEKAAKERLKQIETFKHMKGSLVKSPEGKVYKIGSCNFETDMVDLTEVK